MSLQIDKATGTCTIEQNGRIFRSALMDAHVVTDPDARMSELRIEGSSMHITEAQAEELIILGAQDDRANLFVDD